MSTRPALSLRELESILHSFGVKVDRSRGKGGHVLFRAIVKGQPVSYPVPSDRDVRNCYVNGCRRKFALTAKDGITDDDFYSRR